MFLDFVSYLNNMIVYSKNLAFYILYLLKRLSDCVPLPRQGNVRVDLSGLDVLVAQELLNRPEISAGIEGVGGEGMAEHVRRDSLFNSSLLQGVFDRMSEIPDRPAADPGRKDQGSRILAGALH